MMPYVAYDEGNEDLKPHLSRIHFILYILCREADTAAQFGERRWNQVGNERRSRLVMVEVSSSLKQRPKTGQGWENGKRASWPALRVRSSASQQVWFC